PIKPIKLIICLSLFLILAVYICFDDIVIQEKANAQEEISATAASGQSMSYNDQVSLLARAIHAEAEAEPYVGKVAVGAVLLNRVDNSQFPKTLSGVVYEASALESVSNGRMNSTAGQDSKKAAQAAINGWDPTYGSLFFWNPYKKVNKWVWTREITVQYGKHVFAK
ncbi:MAG: cell wall hydrolase, partial [Clostridiales bacterium]